MKKVLLVDVKFTSQQQPQTIVFENYDALHSWLSTAPAEELQGFACRTINVIDNGTQETSED